MSIGTHHKYVKNTPNQVWLRKPLSLGAFFLGIVVFRCQVGLYEVISKRIAHLYSFFSVVVDLVPESLANHAHLSQSPWLSLAVTMSHFRTQHDTRVRLLAHALYHGLIEEDGGEFLAKTGSLVKDRNLRTRWNRSAFNYILKACGSSDQDQRFWTKKVVQNAISCAMSISLRCITYNRIFFSI